MAKILVVTPTQQMFEQAQEVVNETQLDVKPLLVSSDTVLELVLRERENGAAVVVARGNHAHLLKSETGIPVVEIVLSGQELALLIARAKEMSGKDYPQIALVGFRHMFSNPEPLAQLLKADVQIYYAAPPINMSVVVDKACNDGADVVVGGELAMKYARKKGVKTLFLESTKESMLTALSTAKRVLYGIELESSKTNEFMSLLNYSFDAILKLKPDGRVAIVNYMAEKLLHKRASELIGMNIADLLDIGQDSAIAQAMEKRKSAYSIVVRTKRDAFIANIASLSVDGANEGFILSLQEFKRIDEMEETIRSDRYNRGYRAKTSFSQLNTISPRIQELHEDALQYAQYELPILITGEFGSNMIPLAECIHNAGIRSKNPYVVMDLSALSPAMQEAQLLRDAGDGQGKNLFEIAHNGTLVLESVDMLDIQGQYQLLSVIRKGCVIHADGRRMLPVNVRLICTTCKDLYTLVRQGRFLEPLYAYVSQLELSVPPLREHAEDIPQLLEEFMARFAGKYRKFVIIRPEAQALIHAHPWNGDILQLRLFCEKITLLARGKEVDEDFVKKHLPRTFHEDGELLSQRENKVPPVLYSREEAELLAAIDQVGTSRGELAGHLGISKTTLWRKMKKYGLA
ncbi:MAG: sigma 54-interacting transcriptional regulator [Clostridiales bacterium]|nr:sigma 54-interacting transcriptional regulator [Clostridiales bacterium]